MGLFSVMSQLTETERASSRILVIDDDDAVRGMISKALKAFGHSVLDVSTGEEGVRLAQILKPDLTLCDVCMGDLDGYEILARLRERPETAPLPIILMTGNLADAGLRRSMEAGADDYLPKPFTMDALKRAVQAQLLKSQRRVEHERDLEKRMLAIIEATTDFIGIFEAGTKRLLYLNTAARQMLGYQGEYRGDLEIEQIHPASTLEVLLKEAWPRAQQEGSWHGETKLRSLDGRELVLSQVVLAHKRSSGEIESFSMVGRDISERKEQERQRDLHEMQIRQAQKLESIGQLAAGIAHEINTPAQYAGDNLRFLRDGLGDLAALCTRARSMAELFKTGSPGSAEAQTFEQECERADLDYLLEEMPKATDQALEGVERISKIVRAMKEFSHPGSAVMTLTDLNRAIESTLTVSRNEWKYHAELVTNFDAELPPVPCLPGEFNQVILNLIVNAAHAMADTAGQDGAPMGTLEVTTARAGEWAEIRVRDTGPGIPPHVRERIFEPFFTTKAVGKGTGQGLPIARSVVVDKHRGTIHFETELGKGTTFVVRLPLSPPAQDVQTS